MTLLAIVVALVIEQARPLPAGRLQVWLDAWGRLLESRFNAGEQRQGMVAWLVGVALPVAPLLALQLVLAWKQPLLALALDIGVLYLTMGFRQFSHHFTDIHLSLRMGELERARRLLAEWRNESCERLASDEVARLAIEEALVASHRHVFAPLLWFVFFGPAGALLYRLSLALARLWGQQGGSEAGEFGVFAARAIAVIDWLPVRITAAGFAIVGDFEDAVYCWRNQAARWPDAAVGILLAAGGGALGVRLGMPTGMTDDLGPRPEMGLGEEADAEFMQSTVGLVWRTLVLGLCLLALIWMAGWVGH